MVFRESALAPVRTIDPDSVAEDWQPFLNRTPSPDSLQQREKYTVCLAGKRVLVTGAGGFIGSALAKLIAQSDARLLILLDTTEGALYELDQQLAQEKDAVPHLSILASVCDAGAISNIFDQHRPQIVFHAAAFKHVPLMETNPFAVVANNSIGTQVLAEAAVTYGCEQMLMVSTDKAVDPVSMMGASKRIAELIMLAPRTGSLSTKVVRLGNVLGSSGSVVPLFLRQIAQGGPVTVSHPDVHRYFMTIAETVDALLSAVSSSYPPGLLVPNIGDPIRIVDLARYLIGQQTEVPILFTELRPGDKISESLISPRESYQSMHYATPPGELRAIHTPVIRPQQLSAAMECLRQALHQRDLPTLLHAIQSIVPEYRPGPQLATHAFATVSA
jgi:FlaA1/EpsC-like NDP-sugar epimerase